jgi:hypothetical protein
MGVGQSHVVVKTTMKGIGNQLLKDIVGNQADGVNKIVPNLKS